MLKSLLAIVLVATTLGSVSALADETAASSAGLHTASSRYLTPPKSPRYSPAATVGNDAIAADNAASKSLPPVPAQGIEDVRLSANGRLQGRVVDRQSNPVANSQIILSTPKGTLGTIKTDKSGRFSAVGLRPGPLAIQTSGGTQMVRVWSADIAPPKSKPGVLVVVGRVVRAQCPSGVECGGCNSCGEGATGFTGHFGGIFQRALQNPWLMGAGTAAAIAIPLAYDDDDDNSPIGRDPEPEGEDAS